MKKHFLPALLAAALLLAGTASALAAGPEPVVAAPGPERIPVAEFAMEIVDDAELDTMRGQFGFFPLRAVVEQKFNLLLVLILSGIQQHAEQVINGNDMMETCGGCISVAD